MKRAPRVAAVHDMSGVGRCSLTVILPVLAAMGCQCNPMLTAYLSAHTAFPSSEHAVFLDMTDQMGQVAAHWGELGVEPDAVYSGFLGSERQIGLLQTAICRFRREKTLVLVDPVMGDHGRAYRTCTPELCARMGELAAQADVITPNLTEAALLLGEDYQAQPDRDTVRSWLERLSLNGRRSVVLTGVSVGAEQVGAASLDHATGKMELALTHREQGSFPGTGDLFAAVLLGGLLREETLGQAAADAAAFVQQCVSRTLALATPPLEGVEFEGLLGLLTSGGSLSAVTREEL